MYDLKDFNTQETDKIPIEGESHPIVNNPIIKTGWETLKAAIRFTVAKKIFFVIFLLFFMIITGDFVRSKNNADQASTKSANEDYFGLGAFIAETFGFKSEISNLHPFFKTKGVRALEAKHKVDFGRDIKISKLFAYAKYDDEDYMVMRREARGKDNQKLVLEYSTIIGMSASDFCDDYFDGFVPDEEMKEVFVDYARIWKVKDELTEENDDGEKLFRCVIGPETIEEYLEYDREDN